MFCQTIHQNESYANQFYDKYFPCLTETKYDILEVTEKLYPI